MLRTPGTRCQISQSGPSWTSLRVPRVGPLLDAHRQATGCEYQRAARTPTSANRRISRFATHCQVYHNRELGWIVRRPAACEASSGLHRSPAHVQQHSMASPGASLSCSLFGSATSPVLTSTCQRLAAAPAGNDGGHSVTA